MTFFCTIILYIDNALSETHSYTVHMHGKIWRGCCSHGLFYLYYYPPHGNRVLNVEQTKKYSSIYLVYMLCKDLSFMPVAILETYKKLH